MSSAAKTALIAAPKEDVDFVDSALDKTISRSCIYNENRPHSSLGNLTPEQFRQQAELRIQNQGEKLRSIGNVKLAAVS